MKVWRRDGSKETEAEGRYFSLKLCENTGRMAENRSATQGAEKNSRGTLPVGRHANCIASSLMRGH